MTLADLDHLLRERDVAEITGFSVHTLRQWRSARGRGNGPPWRKVGRSVVYRESDVQSWMATLGRPAMSKST